jgi:regulator of sirC expression with transglutaminase-like and TPR domain
MSDDSLEYSPEWKVMAEELEQLSENSQEKPAETLLNLILRLNAFLRPDLDTNSGARILKFLECDLAASLNAKDRLEQVWSLNKFFFGSKVFQCPQAKAWDIEDFFLVSVLSKKRGSNSLIALIYQHLAQKLNLKIELVHSPLGNIIKWSHDEGRVFMDIARKGLQLSEHDVLDMIHRESIKCLEILNPKDLLVSYLSELASCYHAMERWQDLHFIYSCILKLSPSNMAALGKRALLRHRLELKKEALSDLKRYFAFSGTQNAPSDLVEIFYKLKDEMQSPQPSESPPLRVI